MLAPSVEVLVDNPSELADKIEKHASSLRGKTAPKAKEILQMECDQLRNGRHFHCADKYITMLYDRTATLLDYFSLNDTLVFVSEFHKGKERIRTTQSVSYTHLDVYKRQAVKTIRPHAAPGEAARPFPIGVAAFNAFASN